MDRELYQIIEDAIVLLDDTASDELKQDTQARYDKFKHSIFDQPKTRHPLWKAAQNNSLRCCARE